MLIYDKQNKNRILRGEAQKPQDILVLSDTRKNVIPAIF